MIANRVKVLSCALALAAAAGCSRNGAGDAGGGVRHTAFPGQVTAGGGTSGEVIAQAKRATDASYAGGTPGIAGGAGGNTGGAATGGSVTESGHGPSGNTAPPAAKPTGSGQ